MIIEINTDLERRLLLLHENIGRTPLIDFSGLQLNPDVKVLAKLEWKQLSGSVKARAAWYIIEDGLKKGLLDENVTLLDASSGNTAIAYAEIARSLGIKVTLVIPENASAERLEILRKLGAELILSSPFEGTDGAQELARSIYQAAPDKYYYADQYNNEANWKAHLKTTGPEIWDQTAGTITHFAASLGTTGTFTGVGKFLKSVNPEIRLVQLQPDAPMHGLEGWKHLETAKIPGIYKPDLADESGFINSEKALSLIPVVLKKFDLAISPSAAASLTGALELASRIKSGTIVTTLADNGDKYGEVYKTLGL